METKKKQSIRFRIGVKLIPILVVLVAMLAAFFQFSKQNRESTMERNEAYIEDFAKSLSERMDTTFSSSLSVVRSIANVYSDEFAQSTDYSELLSRLEMEAQFDHVRFVDSAGYSHTSAHEMGDMRDRDYYIRGMQGESSVTLVLDSRFNGQRQIGFYAPVTVDNTIVGVVVAFYNEATLRRDIQYEIYNYQVQTCIVTSEGKTLVESTSEAMDAAYANGAPTDLCDFIRTDYVSKENAKIISRAYTESTEASFVINGKLGDTVGYIAPLSSSSLSIYMIFPEGAATEMYASVDQVGRRLVIVLFVVFGAYIYFLIMSHFVNLKREAEQNRIANYVATAENAVSKELLLIHIPEKTYDDLTKNELPIESTGTITSLKNYLIYISDSQQKDAEIEEFFERILKYEPAEHFPSLNLKRSGESETANYYNIVFVPVETVDGKVTKGVIIFRDATLERRREEASRKQLEEAKRLAEQANAAKTSFLFHMSHDIRTPMNAIMGFTELLRKYQEDPEKRIDYLQKIENSSTVLLSLINNVLEMARIEKGTLELTENLCSVHSFNDKLYTIFDDMMERKNITFTRTIEVEHASVYCDAIKLREIFINILSNAYKYTNPGGTVSMTLRECPSDREGWSIYETKITDTGVGMEESFLPTLFEEFSREHSSTDTKVDGTGLGMSIVKRLLDLMNGEIDVESKKNVGTSITVRIPHRLGDESELEEQPNATYNPEAFRGKRILLAEDNDFNAEIAEEILGSAGFVVERAENGAECVQMLTAMEPGYYDLILMDVQMPKMNGYDATRIIRGLTDRRLSQIPILAMTANAFEEDRQEAFRSGMNGHLAKPVAVSELLRELSNLLAE